MKKLVLASATALIFALNSAYALDISGTYDCKGHAPGDHFQT